MLPTHFTTIEIDHADASVNSTATSYAWFPSKKTLWKMAGTYVVARERKRKR